MWYGCLMNASALIRPPQQKRKGVYILDLLSSELAGDLFNYLLWPKAKFEDTYHSFDRTFGLFVRLFLRVKVLYHQLYLGYSLPLVHTQRTPAVSSSLAVMRVAGRLGFRLSLDYHCLSKWACLQKGCGHLGRLPDFKVCWSASLLDLK